MKTLYVTDLDGTLLNSKSQISRYSLEIINNLVAKGTLFTYATARSLVSASVVAQGLSTNIPIIAYNGAFIINPSTNEILSSAYFQKDEADKIIEFNIDYPKTVNAEMNFLKKEQNLQNMT